MVESDLGLPWFVMQSIQNRALTVFARFFKLFAVFASCTFATNLFGEDDVRQESLSVLTRRCIECHNASEQKGGLDLSTRESVLAGGESGKVIDTSSPEDSYLLQRVIDGEMPPSIRGKAQKLPLDEIAVLTNWIKSGTSWPNGVTLDLFSHTTDLRAGRDWWSLQPIPYPNPPRVSDAHRVSNPIDRFVLAKLDEQRMSMAVPADQRALVRRVYFDVTGLPPTPAQMASFLNDTSEDAYEKLVDRLLSSPRYGERWARYWLDLVRFAETCGYERDQLKPNIWKYRDWVIKAFNDDMPYDRFVTEQLAGDEVPWRNESTVVATGMIRAGTWNDEPNDPADYLYTRLEDMVHTTTSAFLGLTVKCARCHDHKFDPIKQTDYYRIASFFWAGYLGQADLGGPPKTKLGFDCFGWSDKGREVEPIRLLIKGERLNPGPVVEPGFLSAISHLDKPLSPPPQDATSTHRRLQFAKWIVDPSNPLTARVFVNRLWLHHFGKAMVRTPNNFGFKSDPPTHPQLLDWLASEFRNGGWKIKRIHKLILMSSTYRQSSVHENESELLQRDPSNRNLWRQNRRRLDAEALRDSMLAVSGQLNLDMGGPSFFPLLSDEAAEGLSKKGATWGKSNESERNRRSIYMMTKRQMLLPLMTTFDFMDTTLPCGQRDVTTVAPQALALLNNAFVHRQSTAFAKRLVTDVGADARRRIKRGWRLAYSRPPTESEIELALEHLAKQTKHFQAVKMPNDSRPEVFAWESLCHVILNSNEFIYI